MFFEAFLVYQRVVALCKQGYPYTIRFENLLDDYFKTDKAEKLGLPERRRVMVKGFVQKYKRFARAQYTCNLANLFIYKLSKRKNAFNSMVHLPLSVSCLGQAYPSVLSLISH